MRRTFWESQCAFTIVELLMVMAVLGILATMSIPLFTQYRNKAKSGASSSEIRTIEKAIVAHALDKGSLPATIADAGFTQLDPWQRSYVYAVPGTLQYSITGDLLNTDYDLYSLGADGLSDPDSANAKSQDDIVRTNNGAFAGTRAGL